MSEHERSESHTPGPWRWVQGETGDVFLHGEPNEWNDPCILALREDWRHYHREGKNPNARLIAAAPDLLEAARSVSLMATNMTDEVVACSRSAVEKLRAAIAKATGQEA